MGCATCQRSGVNSAVGVVLVVAVVAVCRDHMGFARLPFQLRDRPSPCIHAVFSLHFHPSLWEINLEIENNINNTNHRFQ